MCIRATSKGWFHVEAAPPFDVGEEQQEKKEEKKSAFPSVSALCSVLSAFPYGRRHKHCARPHLLASLRKKSLLGETQLAKQVRDDGKTNHRRHRMRVSSPRVFPGVCVHTLEKRACRTRVPTKRLGDLCMFVAFSRRLYLCMYMDRGACGCVYVRLHGGRRSACTTRTRFAERRRR